MNLLFILSGSPELFFNVKPSTFPIIAALTPKNYNIEVIEGIKKNIDFNKRYDLVAISTVTSGAIDAYEIADEFRRRGVKVVLGGWHPSVLPEEAKQHADSIVIGEAEDTWPQLIRDFESNNLKPFYRQEKPVDLEKIPWQNNHIFSKDAEIGIQATRGCPYNCDFCTIASVEHRSKFRTRKINEVIEELKNYNPKSLAFYDDSLTVNTKYSKNLFREMKDLNKKFTANGNIRVLAKDDELLKLAAEAGCFGWFIGFESINQKSLNSIGKPNNVDDYMQGVKKIRDYGMMVMGGFIFGFDDDNLDIFNDTDDFVRKSEIDFAYYNILTPFPGTPMFKKFDLESRIITKNWRKYDLENVVFKPKNMSAEELSENVRRVRNKYFKTTRCMERIIKSLKFGFDSFLLLSRENIMLKLEK